MKDKQISIAIIGSGPSGCFTAQFLRKKWKNADITIFEALPTPFGLVRYGIAADHQGMKSVTAQFERLFLRNQVRFAGNVKIGDAVSFEKLKENFDVVVRATGLRHDRQLCLPSGDTVETLGAGSILKALNGYPDVNLPCLENGQLAPLGNDIGVIGNGNVAMDIIRILCKDKDGFHGSDISDERLKAFSANNIENIHVFGRSSLCNAKFDIAMLKEILATEGVHFSTSGVSLDDTCEAAQLFRNKKLELATKECGEPRIHVHFHFGVVPVSLNKEGELNVLTVQNSEGIHSISVNNVISAIGFTNEHPLEECYDKCWDGENVFKVGWLNCNGKGTVAENRKDAKRASEEIVDYVETLSDSSNKAGYAGVKESIATNIVTFEDWQRIDQYEIENARVNRCRLKVTSKNLMLSIAHEVKKIERQSIVNI